MKVSKKLKCFILFVLLIFAFSFSACKTTEEEANGVTTGTDTTTTDTTLSVSPASGTYGGIVDLSATLTPAISGKTINFTLKGSSVGDAVTDASGVATLSGVYLYNRSVGSYPNSIGASFAGDSNYSTSSDSDSLTVIPAELTITADNASKTYGDPNPEFSVTYLGVETAGDNESDDPLGTLSITTIATESSPVGTYPITPSGITFDNYDITFVNGTLTVTPAELTVTVDNASKTYGDPNPAFSVTYLGFAAGDDKSDLFGTLSITTTATESSSGGTYPIIPSGLTSDNYDITFVNGTLTVAETTEIETTVTETEITETTSQNGGPFVGSKNSDVYHYPSCSYVGNINEANKIWFNTVDEAKAAGYRPCKRCNPPG